MCNYHSPRWLRFLTLLDCPATAGPKGLKEKINKSTRITFRTFKKGSHAANFICLILVCPIIEVLFLVLCDAFLVPNNNVSCCIKAFSCAVRLDKSVLRKLFPCARE